MKSSDNPRKRILLADDDPSIRRVFTEIIESVFPQVDVETAFDGLDCIEKCRKQRYDLLFLNIVMPRATGLAVLESLKKSGSAMPVWVMSGSFVGAESELRVRALGARGVIPKPPGLEQLVDVVERELGVRAVAFH